MCFLTKDNAMVSLFTVHYNTLHYITLQLLNSRFKPFDKNSHNFFRTKWVLVTFFLVIAWKISLTMIPNLTFYEFCLRRPLF